MITKQVFWNESLFGQGRYRDWRKKLKDLRKVVGDEGNYPTVEQIYDRIGEFRELWSTRSDK